MSDFFFKLGRKLGRAAVPAFQKTKWVWNGLTGTEEDALRAEQDLGKTLASELRQATGTIDDPETLEWLRDICGRLQESAGKPDFQFHAELIQADHPSVIALPGGYLFVSRSLIDFCEGNPHELAFVFAHETAHVIRRHTWDRVIQQTALRAASVVTRRAGGLGSWLRKAGLPLLRSAHSRDHEFEADEDGFGLAVAAGFDPAGAIAFLKRIEQLGSDPEVLGEYLASHPPPAERAERLEQLM